MSLDPHCVDVVLLAAANESGEDKTPNGDGESAPAVLDEALAAD